jgi:hypothetical protein
MCTAAVLCGCSSLEDVTAWVSSAGHETLAALGCRGNALGIITPHPDTIIRVFTGLSAGELAGHAGAYLAGRAELGPVAFPVAAPARLPAIAVDGKAVRGAAGEDGLVPYLLAAATHERCAVIAERLIGPKTNEVPEFAPLLRELNERVPLAGHVITIDAGHTVRARTCALAAASRAACTTSPGRSSVLACYLPASLRAGRFADLVTVCGRDGQSAR